MELRAACVARVRVEIGQHRPLALISCTRCLARWTIRRVRQADNTEAGLSAAISEQTARQKMTKLTEDTLPETQLLACSKKDYNGVERPLIRDPLNGVESREAALALRRHHIQTLGDALYTEGVDPHHKYSAPVCDSHEYGWRAPTSTNGRPSLEMFGVCQHARKDMRATLHDMVP